MLLYIRIFSLIIVLTSAFHFNFNFYSNQVYVWDGIDLCFFAFYILFLCE